MGQNTSNSVWKPCEDLRKTFDLCHCQQRVYSKVLRWNFVIDQILIFHHNLLINSLKILQCDFLIFFFLILSLIVEVYLWWKLQAFLIFLSGRTCTIGGWLNTFLPNCITSALITYDKGTLLDIGHRYTNLFQDTLSSNPSWPLAILQNVEENNGHLNNPRRRRIKKHRWKFTGIRNRPRALSPPLLSILLAIIQSLENKMDDLRARISFQRDIRDCNILCLSETWLTTSVPDTAVTPSDKCSVLRMDRTAKAGKTKGGGVCFMIYKKWCDPRNISILWCSQNWELLLAY